MKQNADDGTVLQNYGTMQRGEKMINHLQHAMFRRFMAIALSVHLTYEKIQPGNMEIRSV